MYEFRKGRRFQPPLLISSFRRAGATGSPCQGAASSALLRSFAGALLSVLLKLFLIVEPLSTFVTN
jgi:hypothetical protein